MVLILVGNVVPNFEGGRAKAIPTEHAKMARGATLGGSPNEYDYDYPMSVLSGGVGRDA